MTNSFPLIKYRGLLSRFSIYFPCKFRLFPCHDVDNRASILYF